MYKYEIYVLFVVIFNVKHVYIYILMAIYNVNNIEYVLFYN